MRHDQHWASPLAFVLIVIAGLAVVISALIGSGGDLGANIDVRASGPDGIPVLAVLGFGLLTVAGGVIGLIVRRN